MLFLLPEKHCEKREKQLVGKDVVHNHVSTVCVFVPSQREACSVVSFTSQLGPEPLSWILNLPVHSLTSYLSP